MWRIRYTLRGRPTIAITHATGHTLIVRRLGREHRQSARVRQITFAVSRGSSRARRAELAQSDNGKRIQPVVPRDDIAMWVTSNGCVDEAPHEGCS